MKNNIVKVVIITVFFVNFSCKKEVSKAQKEEISLNKIDTVANKAKAKAKDSINKVVIDGTDELKENNNFQGKSYVFKDCEECPYDTTSILFNDVNEDNVVSFYGGPFEHYFKYRIQNDTLYFKYFNSDGRIDFEEQAIAKSYKVDSGKIYSIQQDLILEVYKEAPYLLPGKYKISEEK